jgi:hypothetical protein
MKSILGLAVSAMMLSATVMDAQNSQTFYLATGESKVEAKNAYQAIVGLNVPCKYIVWNLFTSLQCPIGARKWTGPGRNQPGGSARQADDAR